MISAQKLSINIYYSYNFGDSIKYKNRKMTDFNFKKMMPFYSAGIFF